MSACGTQERSEKYPRCSRCSQARAPSFPDVQLHI
jgi:hypothetical protein